MQTFFYRDKFRLEFVVPKHEFCLDWDKDQLGLLRACLFRIGIREARDRLFVNLDLLGLFGQFTNKEKIIINKKERIIINNNNNNKNADLTFGPIYKTVINKDEENN